MHQLSTSHQNTQKVTKQSKKKKTEKNKSCSKIMLSIDGWVGKLSSHVFIVARVHLTHHETS